MTDNFTILSLRQLLEFIFSDKINESLLGIPKELFFNPSDKRLFTRRYNKFLHIPLGVAAGPHSQLAQNIVGAWLCGARYIELKTIQTLDELEDNIRDDYALVMEEQLSNSRPESKTKEIQVDAA